MYLKKEKLNEKYKTDLQIGQIVNSFIFKRPLNIDLKNIDCFKLMGCITENKIDLILTDPPYFISKKTGFKAVKNGVKRFAINTEFGEWDKQEIDLKKLCNEFYRVLKKHGTCIIFYDIWKIESLKKAMELAGFKQIRLIIWNKTNPVPINSKINYLTNSREIAILGVKYSKPTFNSKYDNGVYNYPIENNKDRFHTTQKPLKLMIDLIQKHSTKKDLVLDCFAGSSTTAIGCKSLGRNFIGSELDKFYFDKSIKRINKFD